MCSFLSPSCIFVGDSAGGNLAAAVSLKLQNQGKIPPISCQILVYPGLQGCDWYLPSFDSKVLLLNRRHKVTFVHSYAGFSADFKQFVGTELYFSKKVREKCKKLVNYKLLPEKWIPQGYKQTEMFSEENRPQEFKRDFQKAEEFLLNPFVFPLMSENLNGLPKTLLLSAEYDTLRDENSIFVERLKSSGVPVTWKHFEQCIHGCINLRNSTLDFTAGRKMADSVVDFLKEYL